MVGHVPPPSVAPALVADVGNNIMWNWGDPNGSSYGTAVSVAGERDPSAG
jgi:hypothetical protein